MEKITFSSIVNVIDDYTDITLYVGGKMVEEKFRSYSFPDRFDLHDYYSYKVEEVQAIGERKIAVYLEAEH